MRQQSQGMKGLQKFLLLTACMLLVIGFGGLALEKYLPKGMGNLLGMGDAFGLDKLSFGPSVPLEEARSIYTQAGEALRNNKPDEALALYKKIEHSYSVLQPLILIHEAEASAELNAEGKAQERLKQVASAHKNDPFALLANYELAQSYFRAHQNDDAKATFLKVIELDPKSNLALGSQYYLGELSRATKNESQAALYWRSYLTASQSGSFSLAAAKGLADLSIPKTPDDNKLIGLTYAAQEDWNQALGYLTQAPVKDVWLALGKAQVKIGDVQTGRNLLIQGLPSLTDSEKAQDAIRTILETTPPEQRKATMAALHALKPKAGDDFILWHLQNLSVGPERVPYAEELINKYPSSPWAPESSWGIIWPLFQAQQWQAFLDKSEFHLKHYPASQSAARVLFWKAKLLSWQGKTDLANKVFTDLSTQYPNQYYAFRAKQILAKNPEPWKTSSTTVYPGNVQSGVPEKEIESMVANKALAPVFIELVKIKAADDVWWLLQTYYPEKEPVYLESWVAQAKGDYAPSIRAIREHYEDSRIKGKWINDPVLDKLYYPIAYSELITKYSSINHMDPFLVQALMRQESYFNKMAVSSSQAMGLMQILPSTAQGVANNEKIQNFQAVMLFDPEMNIRLGTKYLKEIQDRFKGNSMYAVGSYNGGPNAMARWVTEFEKIKGADPDFFVESIPYVQTREYIKEVFSHYWNYKRLYN